MPKILYRPSRAAAFLALALTLSLAACREEPEPSTTTTGDSAAAVDSPMSDEPAFKREPPRNLSDSVFQAYAALAVGISRREMDSIARATPITEIEAAMERPLKRQDSIARIEIAERYGISRDSVDALLEARGVHKR